MIHPQTTFGFESEWAANYQPLLDGLHAANLIPEPHAHRYHCSCDTCVDLNREYSRYPLRAQTDSSCEGEIVSGVYHLDRSQHVTDFMDLTRQIQEIAVASDAEPGLHAGFHVHARHPDIHISAGRVSPANADLLVGITLALPSLVSTFAAGRHQMVAGWNNRDTWSEFQQTMRQYDQRWDGSHPVANLLRWREAVPLINQTRDAEWAYHVFDNVVTRDRHGFVNWRTRYHTIEVRLLRSTRMAWRMQMNCLLACLLVSPQFHAAVIGAVTPTTTLDDLARPEFLTALTGSAPGDSFTAQLHSLLELQAEYVTSEPDVPTEFTLA